MECCLGMNAGASAAHCCHILHRSARAGGQKWAGGTEYGGGSKVAALSAAAGEALSVSPFCTDVMEMQL